MPTINFTDLPCEIKSLIYNMNAEREKNEIEAFWEDSKDYYDVELEEWFEEGQINAPLWEYLTIENKKKIYKYHQTINRRAESIMCDGSLLDEDYDLPPPPDDSDEEDEE